MECTIATLIACFSWSNLYLDGGIQYQDAEMVHTLEKRVTVHTIDGDTDRWNVSDSKYVSYETRNQFGRAAIGYDIDFRSVSWRFEISHTSSIATGKDRGINAAGLYMRWYPFR